MRRLRAAIIFAAAVLSYFPANAFVQGGKDVEFIYNSQTSRPDLITKISTHNVEAGSNITIVNTSSGITISATGGGGGGGASALEVFSNFDGTRSSPTSSISIGDALKLTVSGSTAAITVDFSSVTARGNTFNGASQLLLLDGSADVPDANLSANVSLLGQTINPSEMADADHGDVTWAAGAASVEDNSHAHTGATLSGIDISDDTNLAGDTEVVLTGDALSLAAAVHRDNETKDGDLVSFDDADSNFAATDVDSAISELDDANGSGPNASDAKVDWSQLGNVPAGFADGTDDGAGGSGVVETDTPTWSGSHYWDSIALADFSSAAQLIVSTGTDVSGKTTLGSMSMDSDDGRLYKSSGAAVMDVAGRVAMQVFTTTGTYTPNPMMSFCKVIATGGGAAGGTTTNTDAVSGGGGAGATCIGVYSRATIGASQAVGIGDAAATGTNGATTTFGALITSGGGTTATQTATSTTVGTQSAGGAGGTCTGGSIQIPGGPGGNGVIYSGTNGTGGLGGASYWGGGGAMSGTSAAGGNASVYGAGGGGGAASDGTDRNGGTGGGGVVVVLEYLN